MNQIGKDTAPNKEVRETICTGRPPLRGIADLV